MRNVVLVAILASAFACSSKKKEDPPKTDPKPADPKPADPKPAGSGSADAGSAGSAAGSGSAGSGSASADSGSGSAAPAWEFAKLTDAEKEDFMKKEVVPTMKPLFLAFDKKEFANFGCKTCHGKDPKKTKYKMPSPDLEKLDFAALKAGKQHPETAKWMAEVVKPKMAALLKMPEMTETNPKGFGCLGCHEMKK